MTEAAVHKMFEEPIESVLRDELALGDAAIGSAAPVLQFLLNREENALFSEEIVARVRGMITDLARQQMAVLAKVSGESEPPEELGRLGQALCESFVANAGLVAHLHALALEWQLSERLEARIGVDPVLSPLLQALVSSPDAGRSELAMTLLAAQARFVQSQRRMRLMLTELPGDLLHATLLALRAHLSFDPQLDECAAEAERVIRGSFSESATRLSLLERCVVSMGGGAFAALEVEHAGAALFLTALSVSSGQFRELATIATGDGQFARLALGLRAAGLKPEQVEAQFCTLHPDIALPEGFTSLRAERAASILAGSDRSHGA